LKNKIFDISVFGWMIIGTVIIVILPIIIIVALYSKSEMILSANSLSSLLFGSEWKPMRGIFGFAPYIVSSIYVTALSAIIAFPLCLLAAIYITTYAKKWLLGFMHPVIDILAGIPSVVYGLWGILAIVPAVKYIALSWFNIEISGYSLLSAAIVLAVMIIPFMLNIIIDIFKSIPAELNENSLALGATQWHTVKKVLVKKAMPGIISALVLGLARAFGETMAVLMVAGNLNIIPISPFDGAYPLPALIANNYGEMMSIPVYDSALMFAALLLLVIVLVFNFLARIVINKYDKIV